MSPASQGALEVERYIGSCLISSNVRSGSHKIIANKKQQEPTTVRGKVARSCYTTLQQNYPTNNNEQCQMQYNWNNPPMLPISPNSRRCCMNQRSSPPPGTQAPRPCCEQPQQHLHKSPLSRLAIHTQGAPLILSGRFHNRQVKLQNNNNTSNNNNNNNNNSNNNYCSNNSFPSYPHGNRIESNNNNPNNNNNVSRCASALQRSQKPPLSEASKKVQQQSNNAKSNNADCSVNKDSGAGGNTANIDSLSIASDESSGSNNSENSLPRIIKPRKRRKKDRKPPNANNILQSDVPKLEEQQQQQQQQQLQQQQQQQQQLTPQTTGISPPEQAYPVVYENNTSHPSTRNNRRPPVGRENLYHGNRILGSNSGPAHRSFQGKVLDDNRNIVPLVPNSNSGCNGNNMQPKGFRSTYHNHHYRHHYHHHHHHHHHHRHNNDGSVVNPPRYGIQQQQSHDFNDGSVVVGGCEESYSRDGLNICQCRYCDPSGLIWDVDQNCYSLYLTGPTPASQQPPSTPPHFSPPIPPLFMSRVTPVNADCQEQNPMERLFDTENSPAVAAAASNCTILRRSWSDPTSYFSDDTSVADHTPMKSGTKDIGVIGDRGQAEPNGTNKRRTLWRGDTLGIFTNGGSSSGDCSVNTNEVVGGVTSSLQGLEVSTEIITSPNGHRDLEIKFYSPSPNVPSSSAILTDEKSTFEDEDLNDIWSYHESKLQQDFRTLLQAEG